MSATAEKLELAVKVKGEIVTSNFTDFQNYVREHLAGINQELVTDADFGQAELDVKTLKNAETSIKSAKVEALKQMESVEKLFAGLDDTSEEVRQARLSLEKKVKTKKAEVKQAILDTAYEAIIATYKGAEHRAELEQAIKGKRNLESIQEAASEYVEALNAKIEACRVVLNAHITEHGEKLVPDFNTLELGDPEHIKTQLELRVEKAKAEAAEAERKKREAEEAARVAAEQKAEQERLVVEAAKIEAEQKAKEDAAKQEQTEVKTIPNEPTPEALAYMQQVAANPVKPERDLAELVDLAGKIQAAFAPIKEARANLANDLNIEIAAEFAEETGRAWLKFQAALKTLKQEVQA